MAFIKSTNWVRIKPKREFVTEEIALKSCFCEKITRVRSTGWGHLSNPENSIMDFSLRNIRQKGKFQIMKSLTKEKMHQGFPLKGFNTVFSCTETIDFSNICYRKLWLPEYSLFVNNALCRLNRIAIIYNRKKPNCPLVFNT